MSGYKGHILGLAHNFMQAVARIATAGAFLCLWCSQNAFAVGASYGVAASVESGASACEADSLELFKQTIYFPISTSTIDVAFSSNPFALDSIRHFFAEVDSSRFVDVTIEGSASPEGPELYNKELAKERAQALKDAVDVAQGVPVAMKWGVAANAPRSMWLQSRSASMTVRLLPVKQAVVPQIPGCETAGADTLSVADSAEAGVAVVGTATEVPGIVAAQEVPVAQGRIAVPFFIKTNLLYDAALVPNIGAGICIADRVTVYADWMHAWWNNHPERRYWRVYGGDIDVSWQFGHGKSDNVFSGHRLGVYASMVTYDFQFGRNRTGVIGDKYNYAVGLSYGYSLPVASRLNIDFGIGIGYMWGRYMKHHVIDDHDVWQSTHNRHWVGPTRAEIGLTWLIGRGNVNRKKEGGRK